MFDAKEETEKIMCCDRMHFRRVYPKLISTHSSRPHCMRHRTHQLVQRALGADACSVFNVHVRIELIKYFPTVVFDLDESLCRRYSVWANRDPCSVYMRINLSIDFVFSLFFFRDRGRQFDQFFFDFFQFQSWHEKWECGWIRLVLLSHVQIVC